MRDSIASTWVLGIVMTFMVVMIGYVAVMLNYKNAFDIKTKAITIAEENSGMNAKAVKNIDNLLRFQGYKTLSGCAKDEYGVLNGVVSSTKGPKEPQQYCFKRVTIDAEGSKNKKHVYKFRFFYNFSIPVLRDIFTFHITGDTNSIKDILVSNSGDTRSY